MTDSINEHIQEHGYGIIKGFADEDRVEQLRQLCDEVRRPCEATSIDGKTIPGYVGGNLIAETRELDDLVTDPRVISAFANIVGASDARGMNLSDTGLKYVLPGQDVRELHRDDDIYPELSSGRSFTANALLAVDPFNADVGATTVVPGSHLWDHPVDQDQETISIVMNPGDLLILAGRTWHGHGPNTTTDRERRAFNFYVCAGWLQTGHGIGCGMSEEEIAVLPDTLRAMLTHYVMSWLSGHTGSKLRARTEHTS